MLGCSVPRSTTSRRGPGEELSDLRVTVLGCCGSFPGPGGACSGYLVEGGGTRLWLDAGTGTMANLQRHVALTDVDAVVLSHDHPDHWHDVLSYRVALAYGLGHEGVRVIAPASVGEAAGAADLAPHLLFETVTDGDVAYVDDLRLSFSRTDHGPETLAVRIDHEGASLGYSADTGPAWSLESLGPALDLALCEATFLRHQEGKFQHMSARQAGESARAAGVRRLVLTHLWPLNDPEQTRAEGAEAFGRDVDIATTGATFRAAAA